VVVKESIHVIFNGANSLVPRVLDNFYMQIHVSMAKLTPQRNIKFYQIWGRPKSIAAKVWNSGQHWNTASCIKAFQSHEELLKSIQQILL